MGSSCSHARSLRIHLLVTFATIMGCTSELRERRAVPYVRNPYQTLTTMLPPVVAGRCANTNEAKPMVQLNAGVDDVPAAQRRFFESIHETEFVALRDRELLDDAIRWSGDSIKLLAPASRPYLAGRITTHCIHVGDTDVMQHAYPVDDFWLVVLESSMYVLVKAQKDLEPSADPLEGAQRMASILFREDVPKSLHVVADKADDEVARFSTLPVSNLGYGPSSEIVSGVVGRRVYFIWRKNVHPWSQNPYPQTEPLPDRLRQVWLRERAPHLATPRPQGR